MNWNELTRLAEAETDRLIRALPGPLRARAGAVRILYEPRPSAADRRAGIEPDTLGLFDGDSLLDGPSDRALPPRIVLYLRNLWEEAGGRRARFQDAVRTTLLHELGHELGFGEDDLADRGLD